MESFRLRARDWLAASMPRLKAGEHGRGATATRPGPGRASCSACCTTAGFAGICFPREYGGLGLTPGHQRAFNDECAGYEMPLVLNVPTFSICGPTLLDMGTEEQKRQHLSAVIRGDEIMVQFLSEPRGGSDLAGVTTRATPDGDMFILNGSKIWSSDAYAADWALCLTRTDWEAPKHRGLTMFLVKVHQPGIDIRRIKQVNGSNEFCQEFFDDVVVPASPTWWARSTAAGRWPAASCSTSATRSAAARPTSAAAPAGSGRGPGIARAHRHGPRHRAV